MATTTNLGLTKPAGTDAPDIDVINNNMDLIDSAVQGKASSGHTHSAATTSANGFMSSSDKTKLDGIATGANKVTVDSALSSTSTNPVQNKVINTALAGKAASSHTHSAYANQNAFSNVVVGSTTISADTTTDTLTLVAGSNITLTPDATNDKVTIAATNTTYSAATTSAAGLMSATDKTKLDGITHINYNDPVDLDTVKTTGVYHLTWASSEESTDSPSNRPTTNHGTLLVDFIVGTPYQIFIPDTKGNDFYMRNYKSRAWTDWTTIKTTDTTYSAATTSAAGLMSASDKTKLEDMDIVELADDITE